jgi:thiol-disulfide isomerase/thioredoxin
VSRFGYAALAIVILLAVACAPADFHYSDGTAGRWSEWDESFVVVNYWAEWCAPCREEIPELNALWSGRGDRPLLVVGVNFDGLEGEALTDLMARMGIGFPVVLRSPRERYGYPMPAVLPSTVVIAPGGRVAATLVGPQTRASIEAALVSAAAGDRAAGG